jgi:hypothetical protein
MSMDICVTPAIGVAAAAIALCTSEALMTLPAMGIARQA